MTNLNPRAELLAVYPHHQQIQGKGSRRSPPPRAAWEPVAACDFNKLHLTRSSVVCLLGGHERSWLFWTFCGTATARSQKQMVSSSESQSSPQFCSQKAAILLKYSQGSKSYLSRKLQSLLYLSCFLLTYWFIAKFCLPDPFSTTDSQRGKKVNSQERRFTS